VSAQGTARRLDRLPLAAVSGLEVAVASGWRARLLGLAYLDRGQVGAGLLIPRCSSVHTFGMRFDLDVHFLDPRGEEIEVRRSVAPGRVVACGSAAAVLERPSELTY